MRLAIDPGCNGGIVVGDDKSTPQSFSMPETTDKLIDLLRSFGCGSGKTAHLETLIKFTGFQMTGSSMAVYAANWGRLEGILKTLHYNVIEIHPKKWQKAVGLARVKGESSSIWKNRLKAEAHRLFPNNKITLKTADAFLIYHATHREPS